VRRFAWRQAVVVGLALLLLGGLARTAWTDRQAARVQSDLSSVGHYLRGAVIVIDPGHGGGDPGAVVGQTKEKDLVLGISLALKQILEEQGARVFLTRDADVDLGGTIRQELGRRIDIVRQHKPDLFVSIHANKDGCNCWGAQTFYQRNGMPASKELALAVQAQLRRLTPTTRGALAADYFVLRTSPGPAVIVEVGFLTSAREHQRLKDPAYQRTLATAIALGMADHLRSQVPQGEAEGQVGR
jgi:N-acetylmuramoyl-L-alanine amidase